MYICLQRNYIFFFKTNTMNKSELIDAMAVKADITKVDAKKALDAFINTTKEAVAKGEKLTLIGFGTFEVSQRAARVCRNPRTNEQMNVAAKKVVKFKVGADLAKSAR